MKIKKLHDLFVVELRCIYSAEKQVLKALPKMARAASREELRAAFEEHLEQTRNQVSRLEAVFEALEHKAKGKNSEAIEGLIAGGEELIDNTTDEATLDAGLIATAQKVEHFEIASYGCLVSWAEQLGLSRAADLLKQTLAEEKATDQKLTSLAESRVNREAEHREGNEEQSSQRENEEQPAQHEAEEPRHEHEEAGHEEHAREPEHAGVGV